MTSNNKTARPARRARTRAIRARMAATGESWTAAARQHDMQRAAASTMSSAAAASYDAANLRGEVVSLTGGVAHHPTTRTGESMSTDELRAQFLDWLWTQSGGKISISIDVTPFLTEAGIDLATAFNLVSDGAARGLMLDWSTMGQPCAALTLDGVHAVEEQRRLRTNPARRAAAARTGLLRSLFDQENAGVHMPVVAGVLDTNYARFAGDRLTSIEIDRASKYLSDKGLIEGVTVDQYDGPVRASLTSDGLDCIENHGGDVASYLNDRAGSVTHTYNINTLNNTGAVTLGGGDAHQQTTVDAATIAAFTDALLNRLGTLPMDENHRSATQTAAEELRHELDRPNPKPERISGALGKVVGYITDAGKPVVTALLLALAQHYGLPPS